MSCRRGDVCRSVAAPFSQSVAGKSIETNWSRLVPLPYSNSRDRHRSVYACLHWPLDAANPLARSSSSSGGELGRYIAGARVLLAGASYREDVGDTRYSGSELVVRKLAEMGAEVSVQDPYVDHWLRRDTRGPGSSVAKLTCATFMCRRI